MVAFGVLVAGGVVAAGVVAAAAVVAAGVVSPLVDGLVVVGVSPDSELLEETDFSDDDDTEM